VMPKNYKWEPDLFVPMSLLPPDARKVMPYMKLKSGVSLAHANAEIDALVRQFAKERPQDFPRRFRMHLESVTGSILEKAEDTLILLFTAVIMLLIIGCVNCSILLLARGMSRQSELAVRAAMGASRYRILRQLIVEALVLAVTGSLLGILLAYWMAKLILSLFPDVFMYESVIRINVPILVFSIALALLSGLAFGLAPSLRMSLPDLSRVMQATARKVAGQSVQVRSLNTLIAAQIALTTIMMGAAGLAIGRFTQMTHRNFGYNPKHVMSVPIPLHQHSYLTREGRAAYFKTLEEKIAAVPGVLDVAVSGNATPP
jgi:predicted lysophospholipase L1 biosynthesis ABC-type transport system permease subunit